MRRTNTDSWAKTESVSGLVLWFLLFFGAYCRLRGRTTTLLTVDEVADEHHLVGAWSRDMRGGPSESEMCWAGGIRMSKVVVGVVMDVGFGRGLGVRRT